MEKVDLKMKFASFENRDMNEYSLDLFHRLIQNETCLIYFEQKFATLEQF